MSETFLNYANGINAPAFDGAAVALDVNFASESRGIWVGTTGNVSIVMASGNTIVLNSVPGGSLLPIRATKITSANTTASSIVALW